MQNRTQTHTTTALCQAQPKHSEEKSQHRPPGSTTMPLGATPSKASLVSSYRLTVTPVQPGTMAVMCNY